MLFLRSSTTGNTSVCGSTSPGIARLVTQLLDIAKITEQGFNPFGKRVCPHTWAMERGLSHIRPCLQDTTRMWRAEDGMPSSRCMVLTATDPCRQLLNLVSMVQVRGETELALGPGQSEALRWETIVDSLDHLYRRTAVRRTLQS